MCLITCQTNRIPYSLKFSRPFYFRASNFRAFNFRASPDFSVPLIFAHPFLDNNFRSPPTSGTDISRHFPTFPDVSRHISRHFPTFPGSRYMPGNVGTACGKRISDTKKSQILSMPSYNACPCRC